MGGDNRGARIFLCRSSAPARVRAFRRTFVRLVPELVLVKRARPAMEGVVEDAKETELEAARRGSREGLVPGGG